MRLCNRHVAASLLAIAGLALVAPGLAEAGKLYQLELKYTVANPGVPVDVVVQVRDKNGVVKGSSSATYDGFNMSNYTSDAIAAIIGFAQPGGDLEVRWVANGYKDKGIFDTETIFTVCVNGVCSSRQQHTSCSQPIPFNIPFPANPSGTITYTGGAGGCLEGAPGCPTGDKLYELDGRFEVPVGACMGDITLNVWKKNFDSIVGTSTSAFDGSGVVCDDVACITGVSLSGGILTVEFDSFGYKDKGEYEADSGFELKIAGCGTFRIKQHTSCSQAIYLDTPKPLDSGGGTMTYTDGCGACILRNPVAVQEQSWGKVKTWFRED